MPAPLIAAAPLRFAVRQFVDSRSGEQLGEGALLLHLAGANLASDRYVEPERFDVQRADVSRSLAFEYGPHVCPGAALAAREITIAVACLLGRLLNARLAVAPEHLEQNPSFISNGYVTIAVQLA
ncbi:MULTISPECIES: hypothetical protein [unclassified Streptomyces]|uniref:hypothetical protein n=1 Tax=unclassified Streptomyces TaxID=2593676 RepID=UPI0024A85FD0|nr:MULTISPECIES: hypothetical protein [unclassified Streptomyces]